MIQPISNSYRDGIDLNSVTPAMDSEQMAFRSWQARRDAARQQIRRLSRRELQVVTLVSNGFANKAIALELEISVKTIEKHRANAARKLGVGSTAEMVRLTVLADHDIESQNRLSAVTNAGLQSGISDN